MQRVSRHQRAMTLLELLVVLAIVALLAALLLPALAAAREAVRRTACLSNQHQYHLALLMYADVFQAYPSQRITSDTAAFPAGGPSQPGHRSYPTPGAYVGWEFDEVMQLAGVAAPKDHEAGLPHNAASFMDCPSTPLQPALDGYWPNGTGFCGLDGNPQPWAYNYVTDLFYHGGNRQAPPTHDPTLTNWLSPATPWDTPTGVLIADRIAENNFKLGANHQASNTPVGAGAQAAAPAGANHLFNDGAAQWIPYQDGQTNLRLMARLTPQPAQRDYYWRRSRDAR